PRRPSPPFDRQFERGAVALHIPLRVLTMAGVATGALLAVPASAQESAPAASESEEIIVLGARLEESTPEELASYGSRIEVIEGETIDLAGHIDVAGALRNLVPGLYLAQK